MRLAMKTLLRSLEFPLFFGLFPFIIVECNAKNKSEESLNVLFNESFSRSLVNIKWKSFKPSIARPSQKRFSPGHGNCDSIHLYEARGSISSPGYPVRYENLTSCVWIINSAIHDEITISFDDLDLEADIQCSESETEDSDSCCVTNWIKINNFEGKHQKKFCGRSENSNDIFKTYSDDSGRVIIRFHTGSSVVSGRGFHLTYIVTPSHELNKTHNCRKDEFKCTNGKCVPNKWRCNRRNECGDHSDEENCDDVCIGANEVKCDAESHDNVPGCYSFPVQKCNGIWDCSNGEDEKGCGRCPRGMFMCSSGTLCYSEAKRCDGEIDCVKDFQDELNCGLCGPNKTQCSPNSLTECYDPLTQRCDRVLHCINGNDERSCTSSCKNKILCASGPGCYKAEERCNGFPECTDYSDEQNCTLELCRPEHGSFLCSNRRCIRKAWTCDKNDDCGDSSDELGDANCLKNSVITAALMGSLICGLLLVIAVSCTCKLIALRQAEQRQDFIDSQTSNASNIYISSQQCPRFYPFRETQLFGADHDVFYREPPPSYSASIGFAEASLDANPQRRRRRERRSRRRPPVPPVVPQVERVENSTPTNNYTGGNIISSNCEQQSTSDAVAESKVSEQANDKCSNPNGENAVIEERTSTNANNIELDNIPSLSPLDCDQQPLLS